MDLSDDARSLHPDLVALRRELHREPEVGLELPRTRDRVLAALQGLPLEITEGESTTSVTAVLRGTATGGGDGPVVLLRGDMDGLPVAESSGDDFAARTGTMHACGHDLHTSALEQLSRPVDEDLLGGLGLGVVVGSFDELAGLECGAGTDERDQVRGVDRAPAVLGGFDELERHGQPGRA